jgi:hypothetical protein
MPKPPVNITVIKKSSMVQVKILKKLPHHIYKVGAVVGLQPAEVEYWIENGFVERTKQE